MENKLVNASRLSLSTLVDNLNPFSSRRSVIPTFQVTPPTAHPDNISSSFPAEGVRETATNTLTFQRELTPISPEDYPVPPPDYEHVGDMTDHPAAMPGVAEYLSSNTNVPFTRERTISDATTEHDSRGDAVSAAGIANYQAERARRIALLEEARDPTESASLQHTGVTTNIAQPSSESTAIQLRNLDGTTDTTAQGSSSAAATALEQDAQDATTMENAGAVTMVETVEDTATATATPVQTGGDGTTDVAGPEARTPGTTTAKRPSTRARALMRYRSRGTEADAEDDSAEHGCGCLGWGKRRAM